MAEATHHYGQIYVGIRGAVSQGQLRVQPNGFQWKRASGGKTLEVKREDIDGLAWMKSSRGCQLGVRIKSGPAINFVGFREKDLDALREFSSKQFGVEIEMQDMAVIGHNWGSGVILNGSLAFTVGGKQLFQVPLKDVAQAQQAKDDVMMELHVDDTTGNEREDVLCEMSFTVPPGCADFVPTGEDAAAKVMLDSVLQHLDAGAASTDDAVCIFGDVAVLAPRGRFEVEMHLNHIALFGQTQEFKIRYTSIQRIFILPKANTPHTLVVISLDPPIRKGQTYYTHLLCQFPSEETTEVELDITPEALAAKNAQGGKLEATLTGPVHDVFARALRGLSSAKVTRPGAFKNSAGDGHSIRCSYKADDGHLYPLDRAFFYVHKPPMMLPFDEVESVEFARQGGGVVSSRTFDLVVRMRSDVEHQFRNINRTEWQNLFEFIKARKIRIENLQSAQQGPGGAGRGLDLDDGEVDPGMRKAMAEAFEDEEDDEDFHAGSESESESIDEGESDDDAEMIAEEGITLEAITGKAKKGGAEGGSQGGKEKEKKRKPEAGGTEGEVKKKAKASPKAKKATQEGTQEEGGGGKGGKGGDKEKKPRKKKDKNAPKGALSAFMYFSNAMRDSIKAEHPGISFGEVGKVLGEKWKALSPEAKEPYNKQAEADKERYSKAMAAYKAGAGGAGAAAAEGSDGGDDADE